MKKIQEPLKASYLENILSEAFSTESITIARDKLKVAQQIIKESNGKYQPEVVQIVIADRFIKNTNPLIESREELEQKVNTYSSENQAVFDSLITTDFTQICIDRLVHHRKLQINQMMHYLKERGFHRDVIIEYEKISPTLEALDEKSSNLDREFYGLAVSKMTGNLLNCQIEIENLEQYVLCVNDFMHIDSKYTRSTGRDVLISDGTNDYLASEAFHVKIISDLSEDESKEAKELKEKVICTYQDHLYKKLIDIAKAGEQGRFQIVADSFVRFTNRYSDILEETGEEARQLMHEKAQDHSLQYT